MTEALDDYMPVDLLFKYNQLKLFPYHAKYSREFLSPNLEKFLPNMQKVLDDAIEKYFSSDTGNLIATIFFLKKNNNFTLYICIMFS